MPLRSLAIANAIAGSVLALAPTFAAASEVVVQSTDFGTLALPTTKGFSLTVMPSSEAGAAAAADDFLSDYGFTIGSTGKFSSAVLTFDLGSVFQLSNLTVSLLQGAAWGGAVPALLTTAQEGDIESRVLWTGTGTATSQAIDEMPLSAGSYVLEIKGQPTGSAGGSFAGVLNVAAVPEPAGLALAMVGLGLVAFTTRRGRHGG